MLIAMMRDISLLFLFFFSVMMAFMCFEYLNMGYEHFFIIFILFVVIKTGIAMYIKPVATTIMGICNSDVEHENCT